MAELTFRVKAEYESAVKCRKELDKTAEALRNLNENSSPQEIEKYTKRYAELTAKYEHSVSFIGKTFAYMKDAIKGVSRELEFSKSNTDDLGNSAKSVIDNAKKRLQLEEKIAEAIKKQKEEAEKNRSLYENRLNYAKSQNKQNEEGYNRNKERLTAKEKEFKVKYNGLNETAYSEEDRKLLESGRDTVEKWQRAWENSTQAIKEQEQAIQECDNKIMVYDQMIEESNVRTKMLNDTMKNMTTGEMFTEMSQQANDSMQKISQLQSILDNYKAKLQELQDVEGAKASFADYERAIDEKNEEIQATENLIKKQEQLQDAVNGLTNVVNGEEDALEYLRKQQEGLAEGSERYAKIQQEIDYHNDELEKNKELLEDTREELAETTNTLESSKAMSVLNDELEKLNNGYERAKSIASNDLINEKQIEETKNKIAETNAELTEAKEHLSIVRGALTETEDVYKGFAETASSLSPKIFISEEVFNRYEDLKRTIAETKAEIEQKTSGEFVDIQELNALRDKLEKNETEFRNLDDAARHTAEVLGSGLASKVSDALKNLYELNSAVRKTQTEVSALENELKQAKQELADAKEPEAVNLARKRVDELCNSLDKAKDKLSTYKGAQKDALKEVQSISNSVNGDNAENPNDIVGNAASQVGGVLKNIAAIAGIGVGLSELADFFDKSKEWRTYFQDIESSMKVFLGSAEKGAEFTKELQKYAYYNMFEFSDLAAASQQMISYGHSVESIIPRLDQLSNVATGTHGSLMELVDTYNRAKATGVVDARGIQSWAIKGVMIRDVLRDMGEVTAGTTVTFEQLNKVLDHITGEGGQFHNLMGEMMNNISAEAGQLEDNLALKFNEIGEKYEGVFVKFLKLQSSIVDNSDQIISDEMLDFGVDAANAALDTFAKHWEDIVSTIQGAIVAFGAYKTVMITHNALQIVSNKLMKLSELGHEKNAAATAKEAIAKQASAAANKESAAAEIKDAAATKTDTVAKETNTKATFSLRAAIKGLNATMASNPWTLAAMAIATIAYACYQAYDGMMTQKKATDLINNSIDEHNEHLDEQNQKELESIGIIKDKTASLMAQSKAYRELVAENEIFASFSREQIANMSTDDIKGLQALETEKKKEEYIRNQIKAAEELREIYKDKGWAWQYAEDDKIDKVVEKYKLLPEYAEELKNSINGLTVLDTWTDNILKSSQNKLQEFLKEKAENGLVEGFKSATTSDEAKNAIVSAIGDYERKLNSFTKTRLADKQKEITETTKALEDAREKANKNTDTNKQDRLNNEVSRLTEKLKTLAEEKKNLNISFAGDFTKSLKKQSDEAMKKISDLYKQLSDVPEAKQTEIRAQIKIATDDYNTWQSMLSMIEAGGKETEIVVKIKREIENEQIGDDALIDIGKDYEKIDDIGQSITNKVMQAQKEFDKLGNKSAENAKKITEKYGLATANVDKDFSVMVNKIDGELNGSNGLKSKLKKFKEGSKEYRQIELEIKRKEEILSYIDNLKKGLKDVTRNPFDIKLNILAKLPESIKNIMKKFFGINFGKESENKETQSEKAKNEGKAAEERKNQEKEEPKKTGAEWKKEERQALVSRKKELEKILKTKLTKKEAEQFQKELDTINSALKKGADEARKILERRAKRVEDELKYLDELDKLKKEANRKREDADIAMIEDDGERERKARELQHKRNLEDTEEQLNEIYKTIYQQRKTDYDLKNPTLKYVLTAEGSKGWRGVKEQAKTYVQNMQAQDIAKGGLREIGFTEDEIDKINRGSFSIDNFNSSVKAMKEIGEGSFEEIKEQIIKTFENLPSEEEKVKDGIQAIGNEHIDISVNADNAFEVARQLESAFPNQKEEVLKIVTESSDMDDLMARLQMFVGFLQNKSFDNIPKGNINKKEANMLSLKTKTSEAIKSKETAEYDRAIEERLDKELAALYEYESKYGSFVQRKAAITAKFDQQIANTSDAIQKASLERQKEEAIKALNMDELKSELDWETVFGDLSMYSTKSLVKLKGKLRTALDAKDITAENAKVISDKILEIEDKIGSRSNILESIIPGLKEHNRLVEQKVEAEKEYNRLLKEEQERVATMNSKGDVAVQALKKVGVKNDIGMDFDFDEIFQMPQSNFNDLITKLRSMGDEGNAAADKLEDFKTATINATEATEKSTKAKEHKDNLSKLVEGKTTFKDFMTAASGGGGAFGYAQMALKNGESMKELVDTIGLSNTEFGEAVGDFSDGCQGFSQAIQALMSGDVIGAVTGIVKGFQGYGKVIEKAFGFSFSGSNEEEHDRIDAELTRSNEHLKNSIDKLKESFDNYNGAKAIETSDEINKKQEEYNNNLLKKWANDMNYHSAHHSNSYYWEFDKWAQDDFNRTLANMGSDKRVNGSWESLMTLSPEEMEKIRDENAEAWEYITSRGKYSWAYDNLNEYANQAHKIEEQTEALYENLTQTTEQNVFEDTLNDLYDFGDGVDDVANNIEKRWAQMKNHMVIKNLVSQGMEEDLKKWYNDLAKLQKEATEAKKAGTFNAVEYNRRMKELKDRYDEIYQEKQEQIKEYQDAGIIQDLDKLNYEQQSALGNSIENISYDQADSLIGIMTSQQILMEQIKTILDEWSRRSALNELTADDTTQTAETIANAVNNAVAFGLPIVVNLDAEELAQAFATALNNVNSTDVATANDQAMNGVLDVLQGMEVGIVRNTDLIRNYERMMMANLIDVFSTNKDDNTIMPTFSIADELMATLRDSKESNVTDNGESFLDVYGENLVNVVIDQRNISADSRDILAAMSFHVEEIRDGVVESIVPNIKEMTEEMSKLRKKMEDM